MIELLLAAIPVALAYCWRMGHDSGRAHQRKLSVLNPGEAIMFDAGAMKLMMTPPDSGALKSSFEDVGREARYASDRVDAMSMAARFHVANPYSVMKVTGVSA